MLVNIVGVDWCQILISLTLERVYMIGYQSNSIVIHDEGICNVEIVSSLFYDGWNVKTLKCHR
jgi:hypothetical protein